METPEFWSTDWHLAMSNRKHFSVWVPISEFKGELPQRIIGKQVKINGTSRKVLAVEVHTDKIGIVVVR
jgi:hypothetical protein